MGSPYGGAWCGALCKQAPLRKWVAYIYDLNCPDVVTWFEVFDTAKEAEQALGDTARNFNGNRTNLKFSKSAATPMPREVAESLPQQDGVWYTGSEFIFWQGGGKRTTQGLYHLPNDTFMQGGSYDLPNLSAPSGSTFLQVSTFGRSGEHHNAVNSYMQEEDASTLPRSSHSYSEYYWPA